MTDFDVSLLAVVFVAVTIDALMGEVPNRVHPVVFMGTLTHWLLRRAPSAPALQFVFGVLLVTTVVGATLVVLLGVGLALETLTQLSDRILPPWLSWLSPCVNVVTEGLLLSTLFALRALLTAGERMRHALGESLDAGRAALSHLCSRDPSALDMSKLSGATVESLAENTSDSFVAPLFWYVLVAQCGGWGLCGAAAYRAINTLDAMVGYRGKYEYIGKAAARIDDVLNWVPARLTAGLLIVSAHLGARRYGFDFKRAARIAWRDHGLTQSPNAGWPMATAAGALGVELVKHDQYVLNAGATKPNVHTIADCERLVLLSAGLWLGVLTIYTLAVHALPLSGHWGTRGG